MVGAFAATAAAHRANKTSNKTSGGSLVRWPRLPMFGHFPFHLPGPNGSPSSRSRRVSRAGATRPSLGGGVDSGGPVRTSRILDAARRRRPPWRPKCRRHLSASARRSPRNGRPANKTSNQTSGRSLVCCPRLPVFGSFSFRFPFRGEKGSAPSGGAGRAARPRIRLAGEAGLFSAALLPQESQVDLGAEGHRTILKAGRASHLRGRASFFGAGAAKWPGARSAQGSQPLRFFQRAAKRPFFLPPPRPIFSLQKFDGQDEIRYKNR